MNIRNRSGVTFSLIFNILPRSCIVGNYLGRGETRTDAAVVGILAGGKLTDATGSNYYV